MSTILSKEHASRKYNNGTTQDMYFIAEDLDEKGSKGYHVLPFYVLFEKFINDMRKENNFHECWDKETILIFALDMDIKGLSDLKEALKVLKANILKIIKAFKEYYDYEISMNQIIVLESQSEISMAESKKYSFHIIFRGISFQNHIVCKDFFEKVNNEYGLKYCDSRIYGLTSLRTCFSNKKGKRAILLPTELTIKGEKTLSTGPGKISLEQFFRRTLLTCILPDERKNMITKDKIYNKKYLIQKPISDVEFNGPKTSLENLNLKDGLLSLPDECSDEYQTWSMVGTALYGLSDDPVIRKEHFDIWETFSQKSDKYNYYEVRRLWPKLGKNKKVGIGYLINLCKTYGISLFKNTKQSYDWIVKDIPERPVSLTITDTTTIIDVPKLTPEYFKTMLNQKLIFVSSEKGTGKTSNFLSVMRQTGELDTKSFLFLSCRRTFGAKMYGDLLEDGFVLYSNIKGDIYQKKVICQLDSLLRLRTSRYDYVVIDESESVLRYLTSSHFTKNGDAVSILSYLESFICHTDHCIVMDADLSNRSIDYFKKIMKVDDSNTQLLINDFKPFSEWKLISMTMDDWVQKIIEELEKGKRLAIALASNNKAKDLKTLIEEIFPHLKVRIIHKETNDDEKTRELMNVDKSWVEYDVVLYTPSVCMGVSFDIPDHFDYIFCYGCQHSLGAQEFAQMHHRVREPKEKTIYITLDKFQPYEESEDTISYELMEENVHTEYFIATHELRNNLVPSIFSRDEAGEKILVYPHKNEPIYTVFIHNAIEKYQNFQNFCATYYGYMKSKGYQLEFERIKYNDKNKTLKYQLKNFKMIRETEEKDVMATNIVNAPDIDEEKHKELLKRRDEEIDDTERDSMRKFHFKQTYQLDTEQITYEVVSKYNDRSMMSQYVNLTTILSSENQPTSEKLRLLDENAKRAHSGIAYNSLIHSQNKRNVPHKLAVLIINKCGFDINEVLPEKIKLISYVPFVESINNAVEWIQMNKRSVCSKFELRYRSDDLTKLDFKEKLKIINNISGKIYGVIIKRFSKRGKKDGEDIEYFLTFDKNGKWDDLPRENKLIPRDLKTNDCGMEFVPVNEQTMADFMSDDTEEIIFRDDD